ncbi:MAG TPA: L,D-transpeptidase [Oligoflexia bacterium]|nr:L,D-transpeptidase [Oligoflexia bacterium]HMP27741.1 L,D-transpeptidase [Oligoflexia bacterium]
MKKTLTASLILVNIFCLNACSILSGESGSTAAFKTSGRIVISRSAPLIHPAINQNNQIDLNSGLAFAPIVNKNQSQNLLTNTIIIDRAQNKVSFSNNNSINSDYQMKKHGDLPIGEFKVIHKQAEPTWSATKNYFTSRKLEIPKAGDKNLLRRGAYGEFAIFINQKTALHNGKVWSDEVGGIQLADEAIKELFEKVSNGDTVIIK